MSKVAVVCDSSCCVPAQLIEQYGVHIVPLELVMDGQSFPDGSISPARLNRRLEQAPGSVSTASPSPGAFLEAFRRAAARSQAILCITLSAHYSGTYGSAVLAADSFRQEHPDVPLAVADSCNLAMAYGFVALAAARAASQDSDLAGCLLACERVISRVQLLGMLDDLSYLARSGRVPRPVYWAASLLQIKPILGAVGEEVKAIERVRTRARALDRLLQLVRERAEHGHALHVAALHSGSPLEARRLAGRVQDALQPHELFITEFTPVMSVHSGPHLLGLAFYSDASEPSPADRQTAGDVSSIMVGAQGIAPLLGQLPPPQARPALVALTGLPGSGKSHFARAVSALAPVATLESDTARRQLFGRSAYTAEESARLFRALHGVAERLLARGVNIILDATNLREEHRRQLSDIARRHNAEFLLVKLEAPDPVLRQRLRQREQAGGPGAGIAAYERLLQDVEPVRLPHLVVDSSSNVEPEARQVAQSILALAGKDAAE